MHFFSSSKTDNKKLNVDVIKKDLINESHGRLYHADWILRKQPPIILMMFDDERAVREASWYLFLQPHMHIVRTYGIIENNKQLSILLQERAPHGNLENLFLTF